MHRKLHKRLLAVKIESLFSLLKGHISPSFYKIKSVSDQLKTYFWTLVVLKKNLSLVFHLQFWECIHFLLHFTISTLFLVSSLKNGSSALRKCVIFLSAFKAWGEKAGRKLHYYASNHSFPVIMLEFGCVCTVYVYSRKIATIFLQRSTVFENKTKKSYLPIQRTIYTIMSQKNLLAPGRWGLRRQFWLIFNHCDDDSRRTQTES